MENRHIVALAGRTIEKDKKYILVRALGEVMVVNVITVLTKPTFDRRSKSFFFHASCQYVNNRKLPEKEGSAIELSLEDIGALWKGSPNGLQCRTFPYGEIEKEMLVKDVQKRPMYWKSLFSRGYVTVTYTIHEEIQDFPLRSTTALPAKFLR